MRLRQLNEVLLYQINKLIITNVFPILFIIYYFFLYLFTLHYIIVIVFNSHENSDLVYSLCSDQPLIIEQGKCLFFLLSGFFLLELQLKGSFHIGL